MTHTFQNNHTILRRKQVETRTGLSRSTIYARMAENKFPQPISLGSNRGAVGWIEAEIDAWIKERIASRHDKR